MPRFAANLSMMFNEVPFLERFQAAAEAGFKGVEFLFPYEHPAKDIAAQLEAHGLTQALFNMPPGDFTKGERGIAALAGREDEFERGIHTALEYADTLKCSRVHVMAGLREHGAAREVYIANLKKATRIAAKHSVELLIEPINTRDIPGYFLNRWSEAEAILKEVAEPNLKIQLDLYHRQIVEGDLVEGLWRYIRLGGHIQIANPPDRGEPDEGEINYRYLFHVIDELGYKGWVGCEYRPRKGTVPGLAWAVRLGVSLG